MPLLAIAAYLTFVSGYVALIACASLPPSFDSGNGVSTCTSNIPNVYRDGGGGGTLNGKNIIIFSDTTTTNGGPTGAMIGFVSNTLVFSDPDNPTNLTDFGTTTPNLGIPFEQNETQFTASHWDSNGERMVLWPSVPITPINDTTGIFISSVATYNKSQQGNDLYNTLVTIEVTDDGPVVTRQAPFYVFPHEVLWGTFGTLYNPVTNMINFIGKDNSGLKLAQAPVSGYADRTQWTYWNGSIFSPTAPSLNDASATFLADSLSAGDIFWSPYYETFLIVYMSMMGDSTFWLRYSLSANVQGPWSDGIQLFQTVPNGQVINYGGHAYPSWDSSGKTLWLSWTYGGNEIQMTKVTFQ